jgi:outer membrane immunogenic protein
MKKFLVPSIVLSAFVVSSAMAADLPIRKAPPAPPPVVAGFDWSGFYIGGHFGYGWGETDITDRTLLGSALLIPTQKLDSDGFLGGVQAGWNYQFGRFVLGTEVDFSWADVQGSLTSTIIDTNASVDRSSTATWIATATTRLGYAWDRVMVYSKLGAAWAQFDYDNNIFSIAGVPIYSSTASETRSGWTVGTGVEWAFAAGWSAKAEYNYMDFGRRTVDFASFQGTPVNLDVDQRISVIKAGVNYRFGAIGR